MNRRTFVQSAVATAVAGRAQAQTGPSFGLVSSSYAKLSRPLSREHPLDYEAVRDMVWQAIRYGTPRAGSLEAKIKPGSWVLVKPNYVSLRPLPSYTTGDVTDLRVTKAVVEYVARFSKAGRITVAEGGSYRALHDKTADNHVIQNDVPRDAATFDWGAKEFLGFGGSLGGVLAEMAKQFPDKKFAYIDLAYDSVRNSDGSFRRVMVPKSPNGIGAFGARPDYIVSKAITQCDFLISVPVMKVHLMSGITACLKNYVGTAPREAYTSPGSFSNTRLHSQYSVGNRIDHFITDLAAFHPPDYCVVDAIRGLQYQEHRDPRTDQMIRSNFILAGENAVATDAMVATLIGFTPWDIEHLQLAAKRQMGSYDVAHANVRGDDPVQLMRRWCKPRNWYGVCNREWRISADPSADMRTWARVAIPVDTLERPGERWSAAMKVLSDGHKKGFLWIGLNGKVVAKLNGETVMTERSVTTFRVGQFQHPVQLRPGENTLVFDVEAQGAPARLSAMVTGPRNDGDTLEGIRYV